MKKLLFLVLSTILLTSCATVTTRKEYKVKVFSYEPNVKAEINDSIYTLPAMVTIKRSKENLKVKYITDTLTKDFTVKSSPSPAFVYGNLIFLYLSPAGYAIDLTNQKRFYYGRKILINSGGQDTIIPKPSRGFINYFSKDYPTQKGQVNLTLSIPYANHFYLHPKNEATVRKGGFFGIAAGFEYYYKQNKYISLKASAAIDFEVPFPAPVDHWGPYETVHATSIALTDNFRLRRFTFGYGINYVHYIWQIKKGEYTPPFELPPDPDPVQYRDPVKKTSDALGLTLNGYHQFSKAFFMGINYSPTLYTISPEAEFNYKHVISLELIWKIRL